MVDPIPVHADPEASVDPFVPGDPTPIIPDPEPLSITVIFHEKDGTSSLILGKDISLGDLKTVLAVYNTIHETNVKLA